MSYFKDIQSGIRTTLKGLSLTLRHLRNATHRRTAEGIASDNYFDLQNGLVTLQYPHEQLPIPDNGRYQLRNEIEDCIVCDKCAKVCPVDCITIDAIKATEEVGRASDGSPIRLYAAKFDIDMAKCCYCGLCTVVCPTECLTMDKKFDYSEFELGKLTYQFAELTPAEADEKRALYEQFLLEKEAAKAAQSVAKAAATSAPAEAPAAAKKPVFRPTAKPVSTPPPDPNANSTDGAIAHPLTDATPEEMQQIAQGGLEKAKKPVFRPTQKPATPAVASPPTGPDAPAPEPVVDDRVQPLAESQPAAGVKPVPAKPAGFRPTMKPPKPATTKPEQPDSTPAATSEAPEPTQPAPKPAGFRPTMKPARTDAPASQEPVADKPAPSEPAPVAPKPAFRPTMKPGAPAKAVPSASEPQQSTAPETPESPPPTLAEPKPRPAFRPTMKPAQPNAPATPIPTADGPANPAPAEETPQAEPESVPKPKPAFRPTMRPKPNDESAAASS
ncbi:4Fe-4S dicluster domain-containing protein [Spirosoma utsteinense]|uniref:Formate hydrogenlyase subunit 6/NADH:ubiquinone oxidoreductase subunit I n=1 Tax=Spirosoma utsteinense TaxID=2585773 RepID=A0ABR6W6K6_9BACT|nr:4Fe-4S dicluster domain-containing protein [Spirosoma utsteinense]MBC3791621.1 formate hydrogenlyase subunit 6/NADH:ubiquinone oxidoreductase subunit I [Spirosoma utsteinense]